MSNKFLLSFLMVGGAAVLFSACLGRPNLPLKTETEPALDQPSQAEQTMKTQVTDDDSDIGSLEKDIETIKLEDENFQ